MRQFALNSVVVALAVLLAATTAPASTIIIQDNFSGTAGTSLSGRTPDTVDLPGGTYSVSYSIWTVPQISSFAANTAQATTDGIAYVSLASAGSYTKPTQFTISASLNVGSTVQDSNLRGAGLGFWPTTLGSGANQVDVNFHGLMLEPNGSLAYIDVGTNSGSTSSIPVLPYQGTWNATAWHTLSYNVNTTTGTLSNILLDGTSYTFSGGLAVFTNDATTAAAIRASGTGGGQNAYFQDFVVSTGAVPEPGTLALLAAGLAGLLCYAWRKRR